MHIKKMLLIIMIFLIVLTTSACNKPKKEIEPVNIHILLQEPSGSSPGLYNLDKLYKESVAIYHELNPQITVTIDYFTASTDLKNGESIDIIPVYTDFLETVAKEGILLDLLPLQQSSGLKEIDIDKAILDSAMVDGELLVLPYSANPLAMLYNKDFFDAAKIPYPEGDWTWEQFRDISKKLKPSQGSAIPYLPMIFDMLLASTGTSMLSPNGDTAVGYLDSPEAIHTIEWLNAYYHDDEFKTAPMSFMDAGIQFNNFRTGMALGNMESYTFYKINLGDKIGVAPLPYFEGGKRANPTNFSGFGISKKSKHPQEAWTFIQYLTLTNHQNAVKFADFNLTTSKSMSEAVQQNSDPIKSIFVDEMNYAVKPSGNMNPLFYNEEMITQFNNLLETDEKDIPEKLQYLALKVDQELNRLKIAEDQKTENPSP